MKIRKRFPSNGPTGLPNLDLAPSPLTPPSPRQLAPRGSDPRVSVTDASPPHSAYQEPRAAGRARLLAAQHAWLPPQTLWTLADSKMPDEQMLATATAMRKAMLVGFKKAGIAADDGWKQLTDDPVLHKDQSIVLSLKRYMTGALGPWPILDEHVDHIQRNLKSLGYGDGLHPNGVWGPEWNQAYQDWKHAEVEKQLGGHAPGETPVGTALRMLSALTPTHVGNTLVGFAKAMPHAFRQVLADTADAALGSAAGVLGNARPGDVVGGFVMGQTPEQYASGVQGGTVTGYRSGGYQYAPGEGPHVAHIAGRFLDDVGTMLLTHDAFKLGAATSRAIGEGAARRGVAALSEAEAANAAGVITNSLEPRFTGRLGAFASESVGTAAERTPQFLGNTARKFGDTLARTNVPVIGRTGAWVAETADKGSWYYKARTLAASAYRIPAVAVAGETAGAASLYGAKMRAEAALANRFGNGALQGVSNEHVLDELNDTVKHRLDFTALGKHFEPNIDMLQFLLHGPMHGPGAVSERFGDEVQNLTTAGIDTLGRLGFEAQMEHATGLSHADWVQIAGDENRLAKHWSHTLREVAATHYAETRIDGVIDEAMRSGDLLSQPTGRDRMKILRTLESEAWHDPEIQRNAIREVLVMDGQENVARRVAKEIESNAAGNNPKAFYRRKLSGFLDASAIMEKRIIPYLTGNENLADEPLALKAEGARYGLASKETLSLQDGMRMVGDLRAEQRTLDARISAFADAARARSEAGELTPEQQAAIAAAPSPRDVEDLENKVGDLLHLHFHVNAREMPHGLEGKLDTFERFAREDLPAEVRLPDGGMEAGVPTAMRNAWGKIDALGYKVVKGTDIGWQHVAQSNLDVFDGPITVQRKLAEFVGLNPDAFSPRAIGEWNRIGMRRNINKLVDEGTISHPPFATTDTTLAYLRDQGIIEAPPRGIAGRITRAPKRAVRALMAAQPDLTEAQAEASIRAEISSALQLRDIPRKAAIEVLTDPVRWNKYAEESSKRARSDVAAQSGDYKLVRPLTASEFQPTLRRLPSLTRDDLLTANEATAAEAETRFRQYADERDRLAQEGAPLGDPAYQRANDLASLYHNFLAGRYERVSAGIAQDAGLVAPYTRAEAEAIYDAIRRGYAMPKQYMLGLSRVENMFRASMGFAGRGGMTARFAGGAIIGAAGGAFASAVTGERDLDDVGKNMLQAAVAGGTLSALGGDEWGWLIANLPNKLIQLRNEFRFELSPYFSARRIAKTNAKLALEGIAATAAPLRAMERAGTLAEDNAVLRRVFPEITSEVADEAERYLRDNDVFGLYNGRHFEAYAAGQWARMGLSDAEIRAKIVKTFEYGSRNGVGRTALERTTNFVFFPFSFDKTLYRNFGAFLLDRPAQRVLLTNALGAYHAFNEAHKNGDVPGSASWFERYAPVLEEAQKLNAFSHGLSFGEPGGINAPLLNAFLPQSWGSDKQNLATLRRFIPAINDLQHLWGSMVEQGKIAVEEGHALHGKYAGGVGQWEPTPGTERFRVDKAFEMQREWFSTYAKAIDYNQHRGRKQAWVFPRNSYFGKFGGEPVTKTTINLIVEDRFPEFSADSGAIAGVLTNTDIARYRLDAKSGPNGEYVARFFDLAEKWRRALEGDLPVSTAAAGTANMRRAAAYLSQHDARFYDLYQRHLRSVFGPLEKVK